jgi:VanZ family protein
MVKNTTYTRSMTVVGGCIMCIILVAGLWPFHAPRNHVDWLPNGDGLHLGRYAGLLSADVFQPGANDDASGSVEIWLQTDVPQSTHTILAFDSSNPPGTSFSLHQNKDRLRVERRNLGNDGVLRSAWFEVGQVFREKNTVFVAVTLAKQETSIYLNGVLVKSAPMLGIASKSLSGRLVLGNSPRGNDNWSGVIRGLAIYPRQLSRAQVAQHYESWTRSLRPALAQDDSPAALFLFKEGQGNTVRNEIDSATSLTIPERYFVLHPTFLASPQRDYHPSWSYWEDVAINVAGFVPLGAWTAAYFSSVKVVSRPAILAICAGFVTSFVIEVSQAFLPTRSSGMTDLITNTLGTAIGVMLCRWSVVQRWLAKAQQYGEQGDGGATSHHELETVLSV